jgi:hypothetical protein
MVTSSHPVSLFVVADDDSQVEARPLLQEVLKSRGSRRVVVASPAQSAELLQATTFSAIAILLGRPGCPSPSTLECLTLAKQRVGAPLLPILVNGVKMPGVADLPSDFGWFSRLNAISHESGDETKTALTLWKIVDNPASLYATRQLDELATTSLAMAFRSVVRGMVYAPALLFFLLIASPFVLIASFGRDRLTGNGLLMLAFAVWLMCLAAWGVVLSAKFGRQGAILGASAGVAVGLVSPVAVFTVCFIESAIGLPFNNLSPFVCCATICVLPLSISSRAAWLTRSGRTLKSIDIILAVAAAVCLYLVSSVLNCRRSLGEDLLEQVFVVLSITSVASATGALMGVLDGILRASAMPITTPEPGISKTLAEPTPTNRFANSVAYKNVFISYRRADTAEPATFLYESLKRRLPGGHVFRDIDSIPYGLDFVSVIRDELRHCDVFALMIGPLWMESIKKEDPNDFVRLEIEAAFSIGIPVVLVLVGNAEVPDFDALPKSLVGIRGSRICSMKDDQDPSEVLKEIAFAKRTNPRTLSMIERIECALGIGRRRSLQWGIFAAVLLQAMWAVTDSHLPQVVMLVATLTWCVLPLVEGMRVARMLGRNIMFVLCPCAIFAANILASAIALVLSFIPYWLYCEMNGGYVKISSAVVLIPGPVSFVVGGWVGSSIAMQVILKRRRRVRTSRAVLEITAAISVVTIAVVLCLWAALRLVFGGTLPVVSSRGLWVILAWQATIVLGFLDGAFQGGSANVR